MLMGFFVYYAVKKHLLSTAPKSFRFFMFRSNFVEKFALDLLKHDLPHDFRTLEKVFLDARRRVPFINDLAVKIAADPIYFSTRRQRWNKDKEKRSPKALDTK